MKNKKDKKLKKFKAVLLAFSIFTSCCMCGCLEQLPFITTHGQTSPETAIDDELEEGEVEFVHTSNPEIDENNSDSGESIVSTSPLSESEIAAVVRNTDDVLAQYPDFSGTVLLSSGNQIIYEKSFGTTGNKKTPNENDTYYQIGSVTKQFTGTAILQLEKEGLINTSDTLDKYFPEYKQDFLKNITISHLLEMSAGMGDYMQIIEGDEKLIEEYFKAAQKSESDAKNYIVKTIFEAGIDNEPGKVYTYSNSAYYLLGVIIEQLTGKSYKEYLQENFFDLAGMTDTFFVGDGKDCQTGYSFAEEKFVCDTDDKYHAVEGDYPYLFSAGSVVSTVEDVNKWLDKVTSDEIFTKSDRKKVETSLMLYNYGWNTSDNLWHHSGRTYTYSSQVFLDYRTDTKMVILSNIAFYEDLGQISSSIYVPFVAEARLAK